MPRYPGELRVQLGATASPLPLHGGNLVAAGVYPGTAHMAPPSHRADASAGVDDLEVGRASEQNARSYQHDRHLVHARDNATVLCAVFDGHGAPSTGHLASERCERVFLPLLEANAFWEVISRPPHHTAALAPFFHRVIMRLDRDVIAHTAAQKLYAGSTLCAVTITAQSIICVNVGDSRAVLGVRKGAAVVPRQLTHDHTPKREDERARVLAAGGWVDKNGVNGHIDMSRAIGDDDLKAHRNITKFAGGVPPRDGFTDQLFIADPDTFVHARSEAHRFIIVATDGIWCKVTNQAAVDIVDKELRTGHSAERAANTLIKRAIMAASSDNCTVIVIVLDRGRIVEYAHRSTFKKLLGSTRVAASSTPDAPARNLIVGRRQRRMASSRPGNARSVDRAPDSDVSHHSSRSVHSDRSLFSDSPQVDRAEDESSAESRAGSSVTLGTNGSVASADLSAAALGERRAAQAALPGSSILSDLAEDVSRHPRARSARPEIPRVEEVGATVSSASEVSQAAVGGRKRLFKSLRTRRKARNDIDDLTVHGAHAFPTAGR